MPKKYLKAVRHICRCGRATDGIKEVDTGEHGEKNDQRIVASNCKACGLKYVADDYRAELTPAYQKAIHSVSKTNDV